MFKTLQPVLAATLTLPLAVAPAHPVLAHSELDGLALTAPASASGEVPLSRVDLERGLERLLLERQTSGGTHIGQQTLALLGGAALGLVPWVWTVASGGSTAWRFDLDFYPVIGAGLAATVGEFAWRNEGYELETLYRKVKESPSGASLPVIPEDLSKRIRAVLAAPEQVRPAGGRVKSRGTSQEKSITPAGPRMVGGRPMSATVSAHSTASVTLSSMKLATQSKRGLGPDVLETLAAMSLNVLAMGALSIGGGLALGRVIDFQPMWGTAFFISTLALGPLGSGTASLIYGDPRGALDRVTEAYKWTAILGGPGFAAGTLLGGPAIGGLFGAPGAVPIVTHALDGAYTAVREKWAREAAAAAATGDLSVEEVKP
jgi:hypothetical protein